MEQASFLQELFQDSFLSGTFMPGNNYLVAEVLLWFGVENPWNVFVISLVAAILGSLINWLAGELVRGLVEHPRIHVTEEVLEKIDKHFRKWGKYFLFISWLPFGSTFTLLGGFAKLRIRSFVLLVLIGQTGHHLWLMHLAGAL